ncbi:MAG: hypothetical protein KDB53_07615, partial [Planctomycetes bacterium]|nr:hypothetical protein [Planctomycetota bacterium]
MGRIHDALKKAQEERERRRAKQEATPTTPRRLTDRTTDAPTVEPSRRSPIKDDLDTFASSRSETARQPVLPPQQPKKKPNLAGAMRRVPTMGESPLPALGNIGATLLSYHSPADYRSEQFRTLRTNISLLDPSPEILGVTSALRGEGVNMTAANLGVCFAEAATERVLIVDADLRDPRL